MCVCVCVCVCVYTYICSVTKSCLTLLTPWTICSSPAFSPWDFLGNNTGLGCHFLLQGIFLTQE